jgi:group I intron endonuclease
MIVYCIKNKCNGKEYIGLSTRPLKDRWSQHIRESNKKDSWEWNTPLGNAIKKYGKENFEVFVLVECESIEQMKQKEIHLIFERKSLTKYGGYNLTEGGDGRLGYKHSEETKIKIGEGNKGKKYTEETLKKMSEAAKKRSIGKIGPMVGKKHTEQARQKIISSLIGRFQSEETRKKRSDSMKKFFSEKKQSQKLDNGIQI